ncbi:FmdE family protein [Desulfonatronovibrio hydrogenovorans]|uniref:FmdE family protein n=1 Tax=Desulfonatronovibrio hydrogenovorans TaxID=53245 RepID=UPI00048D58E4|nr:FmdE family protein [Desulfonatronovibrio hydrogenovorans]
MQIGTYNFDEFIEVVRNFHGSPAPGIIIGGMMVDMARENLPPDTIFDAIAETPKCLPDAIQILTLCTIGNGWLKIINLGRYALTFYDKYNGKGIRVYIDLEKLKKWPEIHAWLLKLKPKKDQDFDQLMSQIKEAGQGMFSASPVQVDLDQLSRKKMAGIVICPICQEPFPGNDGAACRGCHGDSPYLEQMECPPEPDLEKIPLEKAVGREAVHDMTGIDPEADFKGPVIKRGQEISIGDMCRLQQIGRQNIFSGPPPDQEKWIHEDQAAMGFARAMAGPGVVYDLPPREGKIDFKAEKNGLLVINKDNLLAFNLVPQVICASRQNHVMVNKDTVIAGTRAIPLYLSRSSYEKAMQVLEAGPLLQVLPLPSVKAGLLITGTEVYEGIIKDRFEPIITDKVQKLGSEVIKTVICPDNREKIKDSIKDLLAFGSELIVTTAGLSVDPDDVTRKGIEDAGAQDILYGAPILPGAMTMLTRIDSVPVIGVPACALYFKTTSFDLLLPRILAGIKLTRLDLAQMADGGLCLACKSCTYPKCPFGK